LVGQIKQAFCHGEDTQYRTLNLCGNISMGVRKKAICIISNSRELFLSLRRALRLSFPGAVFYFYDTSIVGKGRLDDVESPRYKKAGILIADFLHDDEESLRICRFIRYLRISRGLQFPLVFCSFCGRHELLSHYDVLTYGIDTGNKKSSSQYCPIPIDLSTLTELISSAIPLTNGNYNLFLEKYSGRYKNLYENSVIPLLKQLDKASASCNECEWRELADQVDQLTNTVIGVTPLTCHERILHNRSSGSLSSHLKNEVLELSGYIRNSQVVKSLQTQRHKRFVSNS